MKMSAVNGLYLLLFVERLIKSKKCLIKLWLYTNWNLTYTAKQGSRISGLAQTVFADFGKGVQLANGPPYDETE